MNEKSKTKLSKFLSLILRHSPETVGLKLEENGWVKVADLQKACAARGKSFTLNELEEVVATNEKKRFSFDASKTRIRANQGHSVPVAMEFEKRTPPEKLYHGTAEKNMGAILAAGLQKMKRHHVHLSADVVTAQKVGMRHGKPVIFEIDTLGMIQENHEFFISENGVWLVDEVPAKFITVYLPK